MKKFFAIVFFCNYITLYVLANDHIKAFNFSVLDVLKDTSAEEEKKEDAMIAEVLQSRASPKKEKVEYFNQVTKYGFKNLFSNNSFNSALPYTAQINPNAEVFVQDYMKGHSKYLLNMKGWGQPYFNLIENVLVQYGLPRELKYIAVIESNLSAVVTSNKGAGGPWQFMPYTAKEYGLVVNPYVDERRDYYKSSHAAARYLLFLYQQLHDWLLVMAAYNGGPGRVYSAIKKSGSRNFWALQYHLPEESRTYVKRFIATHYIMEGRAGVTTMGGTSAFASIKGVSPKNTITKADTLTAQELTEVEMLPVSGKYNSLIIAKNIAIDIALFNHYNPGFDEMMANSGSYKLRLPPDKMQLFVTNKYSILNECVQLLLGGATVPVNRVYYPASMSRKKSIK
jgi:membrane-bound lytic murein transglycosylase D